MISLIPKVAKPEMASQSRPISCCNTLYKYISKLLSSRLACVLSEIVNPAQAAFVKGRSLIQNMLVCHDLLRHYKRKTSPTCLIKIDLTKAYDMVQWDFLQEMLEGYKFLVKFIQQVMECVTTGSFPININEEECGYFEGKRGLRQGDPLSPLLFVLVMKYFSRIMSRMSTLPDYRFHVMRKGQQLTHLTFADDLVIFYKGSEQVVKRVMEAINHFQ